MKTAFSNAFKEHTIKTWVSRKTINKSESYLFSHYIKNNKGAIMDAGTGTGVFSFYFENELGFKNITALDIIPEMIAKAQTKAEQEYSKINFIVGDASNLSHLKSNQFDYLCYLQQVLCMIPKPQLDTALQEAYRLGSANSIYFFSFLNWKSRWYNPVLSFNINSIRFLKGQPLQKRYLPELKFNGTLNWKFYKNNQHPILWAKPKEIKSLLMKQGFKIESVYTEKALTKRKGQVIYFVCSKVKLH